MNTLAAARPWRVLPARLCAADVLAALALLLLWTAGLGGAPLFDVDEGAFAEASREMLAGGDWGHTTLNGADRFDKPILVYWLQAASLAMLGPSEAAVRLPSALCAWGWSLALATFAATRWGRGAGWSAAVVLATSLGPLLIGRAATADALLNLLLTLTVLDLWRWLDGGGRVPLRRAYLWAGLGLLAKGPVALVLPAGAVLANLLPQGRQGLRQLADGLRDGMAWLGLLGVAVPWYAYALARHGQAFVDGFLLRHNVDRFTGVLEGHGGPVGYHLLVLPLLLLPWTPLLLGRGARDPVIRFLWGWCGFVLLLFSLAATKLPHYALYGLSPLVLLVARRLGQGALARGPALAVLAQCAVLVALGAGSVAAADWAVGSAQVDAYWQQRLHAALQGQGPASGSALWLLLGLGAVAAWLWQGVQAQRSLLVAAAVTSALWWTLQVLPWWGQVLQGPVRTLAQRAGDQGLTLVQWQLHQPSVAFYRGQPVPRRAPQPGEVALLRSDRLAAAQAQLGQPLQVLAAEPGFVLVRAR